jgi:hypothetical protein
MFALVAPSWLKNHLESKAAQEKIDAVGAAQNACASCY